LRFIAEANNGVGAQSLHDQRLVKIRADLAEFLAQDADVQGRHAFAAAFFGNQVGKNRHRRSV